MGTEPAIRGPEHDDEEATVAADEEATLAADEAKVAADEEATVAAAEEAPVAAAPPAATATARMEMRMVGIGGWKRGRSAAAAGEDEYAQVEAGEWCDLKLSHRAHARLLWGRALL
jgi:hypothetical protein